MSPVSDIVAPSAGPALTLSARLLRDASAAAAADGSGGDGGSDSSCVPSDDECDLASVMTSDQEEGHESDGGGGGDGGGSAAGWADALSRVLGRRAAPLRVTALASRPQLDSPATATDGQPAISRRQAARQRKKHAEWEQIGRTKVDILDKDREKALNRIATRGVVQLFNAVRQHQATVNERLAEAGRSTVKAEHALASVGRQQLLDRLATADTPSAGRKQKTQGWSVLRRDTVSDVSMHDWSAGQKGDADDDEEVACSDVAHSADEEISSDAD